MREDIRRHLEAAGRVLNRPLAKGLAIGGAVVVLVGVAGWAVADRALDRPNPRAGGPGLTLTVVAPTEPEIQPGEVMDVGALKNDLDPAALKTSRRTDQDLGYAYGPAEVETGWLPPEPRNDLPPRTSRVTRSDGLVYEEPRPAPRGDRYAEEPPYAGDPRSFGFDRPRPDYEGERAARREAREDRRIEQQRRRMEADAARAAEQYGSPQGPRPYAPRPY